MKTPITSAHIGKELLEALGLQDFRVCDLSMHFPVKGPVTVEVTYYPEQDSIEDLVAIVKHFNLGVIDADSD